MWGITNCLAPQARSTCPLSWSSCRAGGWGWGWGERGGGAQLHRGGVAPTRVRCAGHAATVLPQRRGTDNNAGMRSPWPAAWRALGSCHAASVGQAPKGRQPQAGHGAHLQHSRPRQYVAPAAAVQVRNGAVRVPGARPPVEHPHRRVPARRQPRHLAHRVGFVAALHLGGHLCGGPPQRRLGLQLASRGQAAWAGDLRGRRRQDGRVASARRNGPGQHWWQHRSRDEFQRELVCAGGQQRGGRRLSKHLCRPTMTPAT